LTRFIKNKGILGWKMYNTPREIKYNFQTLNVKVVFSSLHIIQAFSFQCNMSPFVGIQIGDMFLAKPNSIKVFTHKFKTMVQLAL